MTYEKIAKELRKNYECSFYEVW